MLIPLTTCSPIFYLCMKQGKFVLFVSCWDLPKPKGNEAPPPCSWYLWKSSQRGGRVQQPTWFESYYYGVETIDYWIVFSMITNLNKIKAEKLYWNLEVFLMLFESPQWVRFNNVYFTIFKAKAVKDINFWVNFFVFCWKFIKNFAKFWKEKSVEFSMCSHLGQQHTLHTLVNMNKGCYKGLVIKLTSI